MGGLTTGTADLEPERPIAGYGAGTAAMLEPLLIVGIVIAGTAWDVQHKWRRRMPALAAMRDATRNTSGLELLARRYARGEIDRDEYLEKRDDILAAPVMPQRP